MLKLIKRCPQYVDGYREYCREMYDNHIVYFLPVDPKNIDGGWFGRVV